MDDRETRGRTGVLAPLLQDPLIAPLSDSFSEPVAPLEVAPTEIEQAPASGSRSPSRGRSLLSGGLWVTGSKFLGMVLAVVASGLLSRTLSLADFGRFTFLRSVMTFGGFIAMCGLDTVMVRLVSERLGLGEPLRAVAMLSRSARMALRAGGVALLLVGVTVWLSGERLLQIPSAFWAAWLAAAGAVALGYSQLSSDALRSLQDLKLASFTSGQSGGPLGSGLFLLAVVALAWMHAATLETALAANACALLVCAAFGASFVLGHARRLAPLTAINDVRDDLSARALFALCVPAMFVQLLQFLLRESDVWIAMATLHPDDTGLYGAARRLVLLTGLPTDLMNITVAASIPRLYAAGRRDELQTLLSRAARMSLLPTAAIVLGLVTLPGLSLHIMNGERFVAGAPVLVILALGQLAVAWSGSCGIALMMMGHQRVVLPISIGSFLAMAVLAPLAAFQSGAIGLAAVSVVTLVVQRLLFWWLAAKFTGLRTDGRLR